MDNPFRTTGLRHGTADPRGLLERIDAQLAERIEEAVEMAALHLLVELRKRRSQPAPEGDSRADREEFEALAADLFAYLAEAFDTEAPRGDSGRAQHLRGQVALARRLPDYWQRFEAHRAAHAEARLTSPPAPPGLLKRLFG